MKIIRKREIIMARERRIIIKFYDKSSEAFCNGCAKKVRFVKVDEAAAVYETTSRNIFRLVEGGQIHFRETEFGGLLICFASLANRRTKIENF